MDFPDELKSLQSMLGANGVITSKIRGPRSVCWVVETLFELECLPPDGEPVDIGHLLFVQNTLSDIGKSQRKKRRNRNRKKIASVEPHIMSRAGKWGRG